MKRCPRCGEEKPIGDFATYTRRRRGVERQGRQPYCGDCMRAYKAERYAAGKDKARFHRRYQEKGPEVRAKSRAYYWKNREAKLAYGKKWREENPERFRELVALSQHRRRGVPFDAAAQEYRRILLADTCSYCGEAAGEIDHIHPVNDGGDSHWTNLTAACRSCNSSKHTRPLLIFMAERMIDADQQQLAA